MCPQGECASAEKRVPQPWKGLRNDKGVNQPLTQIRLHAEFLYFIINTVFKLEFLQHGRMHLLRNYWQGISFDQFRFSQSLDGFAGQVAHIFFRKQHVDWELE